jgi:hypothetical protein
MTIKKCPELVWEDTREVEFDQTMMFGLGYDFDGLEYHRWEANTPIGRFAIWPGQTAPMKDWSVYGGKSGWFINGLPSQEAAAQEVIKLVESHMDMDPLIMEQPEPIIPDVTTITVVVTKYKSKDGNEYSMLQDAVNASKEHDIIQLFEREGLYSNQFDKIAEIIRKQWLGFKAIMETDPLIHVKEGMTNVPEERHPGHEAR